MPLNGEAPENAGLDALVASFPVGGSWRLYAGLPTSTGTELAATGGYAPQPAEPTDWAAASARVVRTSAPVSFGTSTAAYPEVATHWAYCDAFGVPWYYDRLTANIAVAASGTAVSFTPEIAFVEAPPL